MRQKLLVLLVLTLALSACAPNVIATSSGQQTTPVVAVETLPPTSIPATQDVAGDAVEEFESRLQAAILQRDEQGMRSLMSDEFIIAFWQSEGVTYPADEAVKQLIDNYTGPGSAIAFQAFQDIPGFDPQMMLGPDVSLAKAVFATGWGLDSQGEVLLFIARRPDGSLYWHSALVTPEGFAPPPEASACSDPVDVPVVDGKVSYNGISFSVDPSIDYPIAARICQEVALSENQAPGEAHPPYTGFFFPTYDRQNVDFQPEVRVYAITDNMSQYLFPLNVLAELKVTLEQRPEPADWYKAPLSARQKYLDFASGSGVRGVVQYMQDFFFFTNNGLLYEFNGLTQDGRYFVSVRYPLSVPFLMELADPVTLPPNNVNAGAIAIPEWPSDYEAQFKVIEDYNAEALSRLEQMDDAEALPSLAVLDALVQSIQVSAP